MHKLDLRIEVNQPLRQRQTAQNQPVVKHIAHQQKALGSSGFGIFNRNALVNDAKDPVTLGQRIKLQITDVRTGNALNRKKTDFLRQPLQILVNRLCIAVPAQKRRRCNPDDSVKIVLLVLNQVQSHFRLTRAHPHEQRSGFQF